MSRRGLPQELSRLIDRWIAEAGVGEDQAHRVRADLEAHFLDGLSAGRSAEELARAFGDPHSTAPLLRRALREVPGTHATPATVRSREATFDALVADLRYALRAVVASPARALTVVLVLSLGLGANAVTFSVLNEVLLRPLPVHDQETLVNVIAEVPGGNSFTGFSVRHFEAMRAPSEVLDDLAAFAALPVRLGDDPVGGPRVVATFVSPGYFGMLGVRAALGSVRLPGFSGWGADAVVVVSHSFWRESLAGDPGVVGSTIRLDDRPLTVLGVTHEGFSGTFIGFPVDVWLPLSAAVTFIPGFDPEDPAQQELELLGRRRPGVSVAALDAALDAVALELERTYPEARGGQRVRVVALTGLDDSLRVGVVSFVTMLAAVAAMMLLIACLNVGGLLLVRAISRQREIAIRVALGAGGPRLARQLLAESLLLAGFGAVLGLALAAGANGLLRDLVTAQGGGLGLDLRLDVRVFALTAAATVIAALVVGLAPGLHALRHDPAAVLRQRATNGRAGSRGRSALVVAQVTLSVLLAVPAGLFVRSLAEGLAADPGFDADHVAVFQLALDEDRFQAEAASAAQRAALERIRALPGVAHAALSPSAPLGVARTPMSIGMPGEDPRDGETGVPMDVKVVGSGYFETLGIELLAGEPFRPSDDESGVQIAVASHALAGRFPAGVEPVGAVLQVDGRPVRVVGVARDARYLLQDDTPDPLLYLSLGEPLARMRVVLRSDAPRTLAPSIQALLRELDPLQPPVTIRTVRETLDDALLPQRIAASFVSAVGLIALLVASLGLYGLLQYHVAREMRSLGIRLALGGGRLHVVGAVLRQGLALVAAGLAVGSGLALLLTPALGPFLIGLEPSDPRTYLTVGGAFTGVALVVALPAALRASRIDPVETLRAD